LSYRAANFAESITTAADKVHGTIRNFDQHLQRDSSLPLLPHWGDSDPTFVVFKTGNIKTNLLVASGAKGTKNMPER